MYPNIYVKFYTIYNKHTFEIPLKVVHFIYKIYSILLDYSHGATQTH